MWYDRSRLVKKSPILYLVDTNSALQTDTLSYPGIYWWWGDNRAGGFYVDRQDKSIIYVEKPNGKVYCSINFTINSSNLDNYDRIFSGGGWQRCPTTGSIIRYRLLNPVEYLFNF